MSIRSVLPADDTALFLGRILDPSHAGPIPVVITAGAVWNATSVGATSSDIVDRADLSAAIERLRSGPADWSIDEILTPEEARTLGEKTAPILLAPIDLQVIKACGVTFAGSMIERLIEERSHGDSSRASAVRAELAAVVEADLSAIVPGSQEAASLKETLVAKGWWSQYLEVGLGPDPEVFTKGPVLSAVGTGDDIGIPEFSTWNNPEPELVLVVASNGMIRGVTMGNDVNLRDVEGRSALLLGMAKDNNRSTAIGPVIRLLTGDFTLEDARQLEIGLKVVGAEGYELDGVNSVGSLSRSFEELVAAAWGAHHQYPDGFVLFTGTLFAPTEDRGAPGLGFTHELGDRVTISNHHLGSLVNTVRRCEELPAWEFGIRSLIRSLGR